ncbi:bifunctional phosphopantothenoylcysteine decarboxylase/phosphopantothenate--cysteine ligase CoaBC [Bartonella tamiae]|uniref:Coenzyme A biosynthesis bifunctional protein CoaBC n=1 Tax=Bartonella tamiae Th239 TaxID=1094558 RepID=J0QYI2_9HYPH|nr:bifunctional phosphopantothenoylcysteine decarboxylase/phosphopantothenate--cysteine ligase CoaBC [Bartonella tamiae]EJF91171.1 phosphopantothenoylcysteine decarboxylase/phosphopantothenate-cysteine ligase [Bartonella tamiae Th239]EJF93164.1 phosphopantothenoylcysteine decarboxylase/phosphopantothenate-cysteine ligase [Bartonella tamiae Th307]
MASITIRNLNPEIKEKLRLQAAQNGHSMEEEVRQILSKRDTINEDDPTVFINDLSYDVQSLQSQNILLIIGGGIAAYKTLDLIRRLKERGATVHIIMTQAAQHFVTPLSASTLSATSVYTDLFSHKDEHDVGHIRLARMADAIIVAPATADRLAKMANGIADDLAGAVLLAATCPIILAPAMNPSMWAHPATKRNVEILHKDGVHFIGPESGEMAEKGENGRGRMSEPLTLVAHIEHFFSNKKKLLSNHHFIVTSGPTHEPIDPIRYFANRSSGKQGHAIATQLNQLGAKVTLISGPVHLEDPKGVTTIHVETANDMLKAVQEALPADGAIFVAAVADWRSDHQISKKLKKNKHAPAFKMVENPDILSTIGHAENRPKLVVGFAAETDDVLKNGQKKLKTKGADFIVANDVSFSKKGQSVMGGDNNTIHLISHETIEDWPEMSKHDVAQKLALKIADFFSKI